MKVKVTTREHRLQKTIPVSFEAFLSELGGDLTVERAPDGYIARYTFKQRTFPPTGRKYVEGIGPSAVEAIKDLQSRWWCDVVAPSEEIITGLPLGEFEFVED